MQLLIVLCSALAIASANYPYYYASHYPQHVPIIDHNGVPVETPEVQAAKAHHLAVHAATAHGIHSAGVYAGGHHGFAGVTADGTPLDTPEVQLAKAAHFIAYNEAASRNAAGHYGAHYGAAAAPGPIDTPEVQLAKAVHFAAHAEARSRSGHLHYRKRRGIAYNSYPYVQHVPVIGHNGVPLDTPEVQAAKAHHFAAHAEVSARNALAPVAVHGGHGYSGYSGYSGPFHVPVIGPHGVPVETPEVQAAKAEHFAAHAQASQRGFYGGGEAHYGGDQGPAETPEVQAAKYQHFAAHAAARSHHY